jgi:DNA mismatch endonuclease, patch repair protein
MDRLTEEHRSWNMSRIRSRDTKPEKVVRSVLHRLGFRFRLTSGARMYGKPDIVLPKHRTAVFVHGCFWHRHARCRLCYTPKSRVNFWKRKFLANQRRDMKVRRRLRRDGWRVVVVWECQLSRKSALERRLLRDLTRTK